MPMLTTKMAASNGCQCNFNDILAVYTHTTLHDQFKVPVGVQQGWPIKSNHQKVWLLGHKEALQTLTWQIHEDSGKIDQTTDTATETEKSINVLRAI